ncbi:MAG TPA: zf-HC2 domain-containing protein [Blastocatellia bacterium]|nr:zf-HC2 domain-containing protein [Blastocatellia bacterium]
MDKGSYKDWSAEDGHPSEEVLLLYLDGELAPKEAGQVRAHLEACWTCRVRAEKIQETITAFIDYQNDVLKPLIEPPPQAWLGFGGKLDQLVAESGSRSLLSHMLGLFGRFFSALRLPASPRLLVKAAAGMIVIAIIAALLIRLNREPVVSASELLDHATEAQVVKIQATARPVAYQKLRVRHQDPARAREDLVSLEIWDDVTNARVRRSVEGVNGRQFISASGGANGAAVPSVLAELEQLLRASHMDPLRPLSPAAYRAWRDSLGQKREEVTRSHLAGGVAALTLRTTPLDPVAVGQIAEAELVVRARDWHPIEQRLRVRAAGGDQVYELTEVAFEVVSLNTLSPEVFAGEHAASLPPTGTTPSPTPPSGHRPPSAPARVVATPELEVEVLELLHRAGADLGEQVSAGRTPEGVLQVTGTVETDERKAKILHALEPVMNNPAVRIEIHTVAEALARQQARRPARPTTEHGVQIIGGTIAAESELRRHFLEKGLAGERVDEEVRQFSRRALRHSERAMFHAAAMKRLAGRFSPEELRALSAETRGRWLGLIREHARAVQRETGALRQELQPVFGASPPSEGAQREIEVADIASLVRAVEDLFNLSSANDRVVRSAFTLSTEPARVSALMTPQFWESLKRTEKLASRIAETR